MLYEAMEVWTKTQHDFLWLLDSERFLRWENCSPGFHSKWVAPERKPCWGNLNLNWNQPALRNQGHFGSAGISLWLKTVYQLKTFQNQTLHALYLGYCSKTWLAVTVWPFTPSLLRCCCSQHSIAWIHSCLESETEEMYNLSGELEHLSVPVS